MTTTTTQPTIAHGIARLHPEQDISRSRFDWGPEWSLPPARSGRWAIDRIYQVAIRVEFDERIPLALPGGATTILDEAREALSAEDKKRRSEWLAAADRREGEAFVRKFRARGRRERGDIPSLTEGQYVRASHSTGVWHIASGRSGTMWDDPDTLSFSMWCSEAFYVPLGDERFMGLATTTDPDRICRRCAGRLDERSQTAPASEQATPALIR